MSGVRLRKDLGGAITQEVMRRLKSDTFMEAYKETLNVFGRCIAQYVGAYLERGAEDSEVLAAGFDIDTWNRRKTKNAKRITAEEKNSLVKHIVEVLPRCSNRQDRCA